MPKKSSAEKKKCFIDQRVKESEKATIHSKVCQDSAVKYELDGKYYCILHYPIQEKSDEFNEELKNRIGHGNYNFSFTYFPDRLTFSEKIFDKKVNFSYSTFAENVSFISTSFVEGVVFDLATFEKDVDFYENEENIFGNKKVFEGDVSFIKTVFKGKAGFWKIQFKNSSHFSNSEFHQRVDFFSSTFYKTTSFQETIFKGVADFSLVTFLDQAQFFNACFSQTSHFNGVTFKGNVFFNQAKFEINSKIFFRRTVFNEVVCSFFEAEVSGYIHFAGGKRKKLKDATATGGIEETGFLGNKSFLDFQYAYIEKPERINFHNLRLQPNWFINVDCRKFVFTICHWRTTTGKYVDIKSELRVLKERGNENPNRLFAKTCWQLADNSEESKSFITASLFRQLANESKRLETYSGYKILSLHWWYWLSSYYGERWTRAGIVLLSILFLFAIYYNFALFQICPKNSVDGSKCVVRAMRIDESIQHSLYTASLQNVEYRKTLTSEQDIIILLEKILAPVQTALLILAIRRKFMR